MDPSAGMGTPGNRAGAIMARAKENPQFRREMAMFLSKASAKALSTLGGRDMDLLSSFFGQAVSNRLHKYSSAFPERVDWRRVRDETSAEHAFVDHAFFREALLKTVRAAGGNSENVAIRAAEIGDVGSLKVLLRIGFVTFPDEELIQAATLSIKSLQYLHEAGHDTTDALKYAFENGNVETARYAHDVIGQRLESHMKIYADFLPDPILKNHPRLQVLFNDNIHEVATSLMENENEYCRDVVKKWRAEGGNVDAMHKAADEIVKNERLLPVLAELNQEIIGMEAARDPRLAYLRAFRTRTATTLIMENYQLPNIDTDKPLSPNSKLAAKMGECMQTIANRCKPAVARAAAMGDLDSLKAFLQKGMVTLPDPILMTAVTQSIKSLRYLHEAGYKMKSINSRQYLHEVGYSMHGALEAAFHNRNIKTARYAHNVIGQQLQSHMKIYADFLPNPELSGHPELQRLFNDNIHEVATNILRYHNDYFRECILDWQTEGGHVNALIRARNGIEKNDKEIAALADLNRKIIDYEAAKDPRAADLRKTRFKVATKLVKENYTVPMIVFDALVDDPPTPSETTPRGPELNNPRAPSEAFEFTVDSDHAMKARRPSRWIESVREPVMQGEAREAAASTMAPEADTYRYSDDVYFARRARAADQDLPQRPFRL